MPDAWALLQIIRIDDTEITHIVTGEGSHCDGVLICQGVYEKIIFKYKKKI